MTLDTLAAARSLIAVNGYWKNENGLIFQWGLGTTDGAGALSITFPIPFPNGLLRLIGTPAALSGVPVTCGVTSATFENAAFLCHTFSAGPPVTFAVAASNLVGWVAIGY